MNNKAITEEVFSYEQDPSNIESGTPSLSYIEQNVNKATVDYSRELEPPPAVIRINNEIMGTLGNFSLFIGKPKSKKTFGVTQMIGELENLDNSTPIRVNLPQDKPNVLFFDTEQSEYKVVEVAQRICKLNGIVPPYERLKVFSLRPFSPKERTQIIEQVLHSERNVGLVIIDGIRDLVSSINSEEESTIIASKLLKWTTDYNIHIITVLHQNKGDNHARGHIGSELINKAETTIEVEAKPNGHSVVKCLYARHREFEPYGFQINAEGLPEYVSNTRYGDILDSRTIRNKIKPENLTDEECNSILNELNSSLEKPGYSDLISGLQDTVEKVTGEKIGESRAKKYKTFFEEKEGIQQQGKSNTKNSYYEINPDTFNQVK